MSGPFDYINSITVNKKNIMETDEDEKSYIPYIVNRSLSMHVDTILYANEMNRQGFLDKKLQYDYLRTAIKAKKRYAKWLKKAKNEDVQAISSYYKYSNEKAKSVLGILTKEQIMEIKKELETGGTK